MDKKSISVFSTPISPKLTQKVHPDKKGLLFGGAIAKLPVDPLFLEKP